MKVIGENHARDINYKKESALVQSVTSVQGIIHCFWQIPYILYDGKMKAVFSVTIAHQM